MRARNPLLPLQVSAATLAEVGGIVRNIIDDSEAEAFIHSVRAEGLVSVLALWLGLTGTPHWAATPWPK